MKRLHTGYARAVALVAVLSAVDATAQSPQDVGRAAQQNQRILQQQQQQEREQRERDEAARRTPSGQDLSAPAVVPKAADTSNCTAVKDIVLQGATLLDAERRAQLIKNYVGKCLTLNDINQLIADITNAYIARGYVTARVYIPAQDLASGTLQLLVVEGRLQSILIKPADSASAATAFPSAVGKPLNLRDIEQGLDQINRLHSNSATIDIQPGDGPGASELIVNNVTDKRWQAALGVDNSGARTTGLTQYSATLGLDNLFNVNDYANLNARRSGGGSEYSESETLYGAVPYGYWTFSGSFNQLNYSSLVAGQAQTFESTGSSLTQNLTAERVVYRDQLTKWSVISGLTLKQIRNYIEGEALDTTSPNLSIFNLSTNVTRLWHDTLFAFDAGVDKGLSAFGALDDSSDLPSNTPHAQYEIWRYGASATRTFAFGTIFPNNAQFKWQSDLRGQYSREQVYGTEQLAIGSLFTVRGFRDTVLSGQRGAYLRNTFGMPIDVNRPAFAAQLQPYIGYDIGHVNDQRTLSGWTLGCDFAMNKVNAQIAYSHPASGPDNSGSNEPRETGWIYGSLTFTF